MREQKTSPPKRARLFLKALLKTMVRMRGLEPPRCHHHRLLRPARLPVPPHPHAVNSLCEAAERVSRMQFATSDCGTAGVCDAFVVAVAPAAIPDPVVAITVSSVAPEDTAHVDHRDAVRVHPNGHLERRGSF